MEYNDPTFFESVLKVLWPVWWVVGKIFILGLVVLGIGFGFWTVWRTIKKLKVDLDEYPGIAAIEFCGVLAGLVYLVPQVSYY